MKKFNLKNKIFFALGIFTTCLVFLCSIFSFNNQNQISQISNASTEYVDSGEYITKLYNPNKQYASSYDMTTHIPLTAENQTDSNFCWIYSSLKVLESSLMIQRNEYHNFSEIGSAYLYYVNITKNQSDGFDIFDTTGNFANFNILTQNYGLVYESSFSNDLYFDINEENYENYDYILDYVDTEIMRDIRPINIHADTSFISLKKSNKIQVMKEYILTYGGIFAGLEKGLISSGMYVRTDDPAYSENDKAISTSHAVCLIGWNEDKQAFLALNSWGVEKNSYSTFYIPYDYEYLYSDIYGYICLNENTSYFNEVSSNAGGDDGFSSKVNSNYIDQENLFIYGETVELSYSLVNISDFDNVYINIFKGLENVTNEFLIEFFDDTQTIKITSNNSASLGEGYFIKFLEMDEVIGYKDFYVFTGTEVSYIQLIQDNNNQDLDSILFNSVFASGNFTQTYYINNEERADYNLNMYLVGLSNFTKSNINVVASQAYSLIDDGNGNMSFVDDGEISAKVESTGTILNLFRINVADLASNNSGKSFMVQVTFESKITTARTTYTFIFFISQQTDIKTKNANKIVYELEGGKNSIYNINRYPHYEFEQDVDFVAYPLSQPTRYNSTFIGWYLDKEYTIEITEISKDLMTLLDDSLDIIIYARWEQNEVDYFDIDLKISKVVDYYGNEENYIGQKIIYGDSLILQFDFLPNSENLTTYKYISRYDYYFENNFIKQDYMNENGCTLYFENSFKNDKLVCGTYTAEITVLMIISHQFSVSKEVSLTYEITPKDDVTVQFDKDTLLYEYDKKEHSPSVTFNGIYDIDLSDLTYEFNIAPVVDAGVYTFKVESISNKNYILSGSASVQLEITRKKITINWFNLEKEYNGTYLMPEYEISGTIDDEFVEISFSETGTGIKFQKKNVGIYNISISEVLNKNYQFEGVTSSEFVITPASITITFANISERFTVAPNNRKKVTYEVTGNLYDDEKLLQIIYQTEGESTLESGEYPIVGRYVSENDVNRNYITTFVNGTYTILGYYYVYYTLPNNETYVEVVDDGYNPVGITEEIYDKPLFSNFVYDTELVCNGYTDLYVKVSIKSYAWMVWGGIILFGFAIIYLTSSKKARRNKTR